MILKILIISQDYSTNNINYNLIGYNVSGRYLAIHAHTIPSLWFNFVAFVVFKVVHKIYI